MARKTKIKNWMYVPGAVLDAAPAGTACVILVPKDGSQWTVINVGTLSLARQEYGWCIHMHPSKRSVAIYLVNKRVVVSAHYGM